MTAQCLLPAQVAAFCYSHGIPSLGMHEECRRCTKRRSILPAPAQVVLLSWDLSQRQHQAHIF